MPPSTPQNADQEPSQHKKHSHADSLKSRTSNPVIRCFRKLFRSTTHSKPSSESFTPQEGGTEHKSYKGVEYSDFGSHSLPPTGNAQSIKQGFASGSTFQDAHHFSISGNARIVNIGQNVNNPSIYGLDNLKEFVSFSALHDSSAQDPERCCHPGTRQNVLNCMRTWIDDPNTPERILWLHGPAGVGKSAIAQTISYSYLRDKVGATFFFFRSDPIRNDGNRLLPTLAWQLALSVPTVKDVIASSLQEYPDLPRKTVEIQFNNLITQPFLAMYGSKSTAPMRVIIIDGLDECSDVKLQERILKVIGDIVANTRFPLRFLISSRPEAHIHDFFKQYQHPTLRIDLGNVDEAHRDIEKYLISEFARIAVEQEFDPRTQWPGQRIIDTLVSKSSGQFVYASTVIKYVGDKYESAIAQLNVILGLKPSTGKSPFSELDALYIEILKRQPDQEFLREFLAILVALSMLTGMIGGDFHEDNAMLLGLDEKQLHRKLRGMRSLLKFEPSIDVHHKSFLDFLDESSRSGDYHVNKKFANRRYMELITDTLIKAAPRAMEQPNSHRDSHFKPRFATVIKYFPLPIKLPLSDLEEILRPLRIIQENLLQLPNMSVPWEPKPCEKCWTLYMIDDLLLQLSLIRGTTQSQEPRFSGIRPLTAMEERRRIPQLDLDACLSLLLPKLRGVEASGTEGIERASNPEHFQLPLNMDTIGLVRALIHFEPSETAMKMRTVTDAQILVDLIFCLNKNGCFKSWFGTAASNATRLALEIWGRVPVLPGSLCLNTADLSRSKRTYQGKAIRTWSDVIVTIWPKCFDAFVWGGLSHSNVGPFLGLCSIGPDQAVVSPGQTNGTLSEWRDSTNASVSEYQRIAFEVAKAIQHIHALGIVIRKDFHTYYVYLDSDNHAKVTPTSFRPNRVWNRGFDYDNYDETPFTLEDNVRSFGCFFYQLLFNQWAHKPNIRPKEPEIPDNVWRLIQWCCAEDKKKRLTIDQVVQEMESWIALGQVTLSKYEDQK